MNIISAVLIIACAMLNSCSKGDAMKYPGEKTDKEVKQTSTGLLYVDMLEGTGDTPKSGDKVTVHYSGFLMDGKKFDSSPDREQPFVFVIGYGQVIKGWDEGVATMKVGGKRKIVVPSHLGYGSRGVPGLIPPGADLVFDVELLGVK